MTSVTPRVVIAGARSGVGKTSVAIGLTHALSREGMTVQTYKVGPDFLDPTYLARASGRPCYNLDGWMAGREHVLDLFARTASDADIAIIEGVMGLFDGAEPSRLEGSTAEIAKWLDAPVLLVVHAHGVARSLAATVKGFATFEPGVHVDGVIANYVGSESHRRILEESLASSGGPPLVGAFQGGAFPELKRRHLGLVTAGEDAMPSETLSQLADACVLGIDFHAVQKMAESAGILRSAKLDEPPCPRGIRLGVAMDEAFHFYYQDTLDALDRAGCELAFFSPVSDEGLPHDLDAVYLGGGYPEFRARELSQNVSMRDAMRRFAASGRALYAECGGLMFLSRAVTTQEGETFPMVGLLPTATRVLDRRKALRYVEVTLTHPSLWGPEGAVCRGHEFHYSELIDDPIALGWRAVYSVRHRQADTPTPEGFQKDNVLASYVHLHWASRPQWIRHFVSSCKERSCRRDQA